MSVSLHCTHMYFSHVFVLLIHVGCSRENFKDILGDDEDFLTAMNDDVDGCKSDEVG